MRFKTHTLALFALVLLPTTVLAEGEKTAVGDAVQGSRLFRIHCAQCHGADGKGAGIVKPVPVAPDLTNPSRMTLFSDRTLFNLLEKGGKAAGMSESMPVFGDALSDLEIWDLVSFLRTRSLGLTDFFPDAESFFGDVYTIDQWGAERHQVMTKTKLTAKNNTYTVLGVYKGDQGPEGPRLIPNDPMAVARIDRFAKNGYVIFVDGQFPGVKGTHTLGIGMDKNGLVWKVLVNTDDAKVKKVIEKMMEPWLGYGDKGMKDPFEPFGRSKKDKAMAKAWTEIYSRAMESVVMYDKAERERHWADADFGGAAEPDASVEGGALEVQNPPDKRVKNKKK